MGKVFSDKPIGEIVLRKFERPSGADKNELLRKFCISLGLLQPGDSRDVIVYVLKVMVDSCERREMLSSKEIEEKVRELTSSGTASSNIRRQLMRLQRINILERIKDRYRIVEFSKLSDVMENIENFIVKPVIQRIKEYAKEIDDFS